MGRFSLPALAVINLFVGPRLYHRAASEIGKLKFPRECNISFNIIEDTNPAARAKERMETVISESEGDCISEAQANFPAFPDQRFAPVTWALQIAVRKDSVRQGWNMTEDAYGLVQIIGNVLDYDLPMPPILMS